MFKSLIFLFLFFSSIAFAQLPPPAKEFYTESKTAIMVTSDHPQFIIKLKSNPTTGYSWFLREYNTDLLTPTKHIFEVNGDKKLMGAPGYETWTFHVKQGAFHVPQQTMIRFVYTRPWEDSNQSKQIAFSISTLSTPSVSPAEKLR